jgi:hypothetical protein
MNELGAGTPTNQAVADSSLHAPLVASPPPPMGRPRPPLPAPSPEDFEGQELVAVAAGLVPLVIALYALMSAGKRIDGSYRFMITFGIVGIHGVILLSVGTLLARRPLRVPAGRALVALAAVFAPFIAATSWAAPRNNLNLLITAAATGLGALAAWSYARLSGRNFRTILPLVGAILLLGLAGRVAGFFVPVFPRTTIVLHVAASLIACGVFLRPDRAIEPPGAIAMALAVPLAAIVISTWWSGGFNLERMAAIAVAMVWAMRALRPYFHDGAVTMFFGALFAMPLLLAGDGIHSRHLGLIVGVVAMLRTSAEFEGDPNVGAVDRHSPAWLASALWLLLTSTWAHDLRIIETLVGQPRGFGPASLVWVGLFALPMALPPLLLGRVRRRSMPPDAELDGLAPGAVAEITGWAVLTLATASALVPTSRNMWPLVSLAVAGGAALGSALWALSNPSAARRVAAHLLLLCAVWLFAVREDAVPMTLVASAAALVLALWPLVRGRVGREAGAVGFALFPVLIAEALVRGAPIPAAAAMLTVFGLVQLLRPPLEFPATRIAGPIALVAAVWIFLSGSAQTAHGLLQIPHLLRGDPLPIIGLLGAAMALPLFLLAQRQRRQSAQASSSDDSDLRPLELDPADPGVALEALGWTFIGLSAAIALVPAWDGWLSVVTLTVGWAAAVGIAWVNRTLLRRLGAHVLLVAACWALGWHVGSPIAAFSASAVACLLALVPIISPLGGRESAWVGCALFPFAVGEALARGAPPLPAAVLLGIFGIALLIRTPVSGFPWMRALGPPALLASAWLVLFRGVFVPPALGPAWLTLAAALALTPLALRFALADGPFVFVLEVLVGSIVLLLVDAQPAALLPLAILALGKNEIGFAAGASTLLLGAAGVVSYGPPVGVPVGAGAFLIAGGVFLLRPLPIDVQRLRTLGPLSIFLAPMVLLFVTQSGGRSWLAVEHFPLAAAVCLLPFVAWVRRSRGPGFVIWQTVVAAVALAILSIVAVFVLPPRSALAIEASCAALLALAAAVAASGPLGPEVSPVVWGFAALAAPIALIPMSIDPLHWPVAVVGAIEVMILGEAARRRTSPILAAWALWLGLLVSIWISVALGHQFLGDAPWALLAVAGAAVGLTGLLVLLRGRVWLGAPIFFLRPFIHVCLALASVSAAATVVLGPVSQTAEVVPSLLGLGMVGILAGWLSWQARIGWPLFLAAGSLVVGYVHLRLRTSFAGWLDHRDGLLAVAAGLGLTRLEGSWHVGEIPDPTSLPRAPDEIPFALPPLRIITAFLMGLSAVAFLNLRSPVDAMAPAVATLFFYRRSRIEVPVYAVLAVLFFDATVAALLTTARINSPGAYALPICASAAWFLRVYRDHLGHEEGALRAMPPLIALTVSGYEAFGSTAIAPTVVLLGIGVALVALWRRWFLTSHLVLGVVGLLLAGLDFALDHHIGTVSQPGQGMRLLPLFSFLAAVAGALVIRFGARLFIDPAEYRSPVVRGLLALAWLPLGVALVVGPSNTVIDVGLTLGALGAVAALAMYFGRFERLGWPLLVAGAAPILAYGFLRARTDWLDQLHRLDALVAIGAGLLLIGLERLVCKIADAPLDFALAAPEEIPFGIREIRLGTAVVMALSAVAFLDLHGPVDAVGPVLATLFFLSRARRDTPGYGLMALILSTTTLVLFLIDRRVTNPIAFALPLAAAAVLWMHVYREQLGYEANSLRTIPPLATAAVCVFQAINGDSILVPTLALVGIGLVLLLLSKLWHLRSHFPIALGCLGAALLIMISDWNSRGWTVGALALGVATLLVPAVLLRSR